MSIEQHPGPAPERGPDPAQAEVGATLTRLLHGLTLAVLDVADEPRAHEEPAVEDVAPPARERRSTSLLSELTFLDD